MRNLHADEVATDEVSIALAPMLQPSWTADPFTWNPTGPVFDDAGNLYYVPFLSLEGVALVSLDPVTGQRRWTIPNTSGAPTGGGTPMVLDDPDVPGAQIVYVGLYDRVFAVRADGSIVWDQPTGLPGPPPTVFGVNYHPAADAIVGLSGDGYLYAVDRRTGVSVLTAPYQLPGTVSPPGPPPLAPPNVLACVQAELAAMADLGSFTVQDLGNVLLGNASEVSNFFSIDPLTGRLWVGATAPPVGGIAKFAPTRYDLFFRDVACAGADRFRNARRNRRLCPAGYAADQRQLDALFVQARQTLDAGTASGDIAAAVVTRLDGRLDRAEARRAHGRNATGALKALCRTIERALG